MSRGLIHIYIHYSLPQLSTSLKKKLTAHKVAFIGIKTDFFIEEQKNTIYLAGLSLALPIVINGNKVVSPMALIFFSCLAGHQERQGPDLSGGGYQPSCPSTTSGNGHRLPRPSKGTAPFPSQLIHSKLWSLRSSLRHKVTRQTGQEYPRHTSVEAGAPGQGTVGLNILSFQRSAQAFASSNPSQVGIKTVKRNAH